MLVIRSQKLSRINEFLKNNSPTSLVGTTGDSWKKYLSANGGTGQTFHDLEKSYLAAQASGGGTLHDLWSFYVNGLGFVTGVARQRVRAWLESITVVTSYYLLEDGISHYLLEDGSGAYILE